MCSVKKDLALAGVFAEDSENERSFHGFSDGEVEKECKVEEDDSTQSELSPKKEKTSSKPPGAQRFRLRVALRSSSSTQQSTGDEKQDTEDEEEEKRPLKRGMKMAGTLKRAKKMRHAEAENDDTDMAQPSTAVEQGSGSEEDAADSFLAKRQQNIMANKAMLAQLMADLQKMPGGAGLLKKHEGKQKTKGKSYRPPRSREESRRNPDRASRRMTRSMGGAEGLLTPKKEELEISLEEELLEVRRAPQSRAPRASQNKPHLIRPVEDITEDELQLVAENMTDKVYNKVTGSTCHQCRQKTIDTKTCCRSEDCRGIQGQFCGPCLRNRYGEDVKKALLDPEWRCPPCRGICNCSFCRQREGRCPTGILFPLAQYHGFSDVHSYLTSLRNKLKGEGDVEM